MTEEQLVKLIAYNSSANMSQEACDRQAKRIATAIMESEVCVPRAALEFVLEYANFCDEGPPGEGWSSPKMDLAISALEASLAALPQS